MFARFRNPWWIVVAGYMGCAVGAGPLMGFAFGVFAKPISEEFGWPRSTLALGLTAFLIASGLGALGLGYAISCWGVRRTSIMFVSIFAAAVGATGLLPNSPTLMYLDFSILGFFGAAACALPYSVSISGWFDEHRGLALGIAVSGAGLGAWLGPPFSSWLLAHIGWGGGIGTYLAGAAYDTTQSYVVALWIFGITLLASAVIVALLGPYRFPVRRRQSAVPGTAIPAGNSSDLDGAKSGSL